jgi:glyceraldehyde 3-phosphate dehydrogenase
MTPTKTGAAKAIDRVLPELAGRIVGIAVRVPIPDVSLVDLDVTLERTATVEQINDLFRQAAEGPVGRVLAVTDEPLVSSDFHGDTHSAIVDLASTRWGPQNQAKVLAWYDNEAGYAARVVDVCRLMGGAREGEGTAEADRSLVGSTLGEG